MKKAVLYIAMSLDGYIAGTDDNLDFLSTVEKENEDYGYYKFLESVDSVIMGRKTYEKILSFGIGFPHPDKECYILSRKNDKSAENVHFYNGNLAQLIAMLKQNNNKDIFIDGGAETVNALLSEKLIDEIIISIIPILLGSGVALFKNNRVQQKLELVSSKSFEMGLVQLHYKTIS